MPEGESQTGCTLGCHSCGQAQAGTWTELGLGVGAGMGRQNLGLLQRNLVGTSESWAPILEPLGSSGYVFRLTGLMGEDVREYFRVIEDCSDNGAYNFKKFIRFSLMSHKSYQGCSNCILLRATNSTITVPTFQVDLLEVTLSGRT